MARHVSAVDSKFDYLRNLLNADRSWKTGWRVDQICGKEDRWLSPELDWNATSFSAIPVTNCTMLLIKRRRVSGHLRFIIRAPQRAVPRFFTLQRRKIIHERSAATVPKKMFVRGHR